MIITEREISIYRDFSRINEKVVLYRGDFEVELHFKIKNNRYSFLNGIKLLESEYAHYAQMVILTPCGDSIFSEVSRCVDGVIKFILTEEMIDSINEVGSYSFQIRLFDSTMTSRITIPPIENGLEIKEPITSEDVNDKVDDAMVNFAVLRNVVSDDIPDDIFDANGNYIKYEWSPGSRITADKLNRLENAIEMTNDTFEDLSRQSTNNLTLLTNRMYNLHDCVSVAEFGIQPGTNVDVTENTRRFQEMIEFCKNKKTIVFPSGIFIFNEVDLGVENTISIRGTTSSFASFAKRIDDDTISDQFTRIICNADSGKTFFNNRHCVLILENIAFYNYVKGDTDGTFIPAPAMSNTFMQHTRTDDTGSGKTGKVFCHNSAFYGWKVVFGNEFTMQHVENEIGSGLAVPDASIEYAKTSCVTASYCRFVNNAVSINNPFNSHITHCTFDGGIYAIMLNVRGGNTSILGCRIERMKFNGMRCEDVYNVLVDNCEFAYNGRAGIYARLVRNSNFSGMFITNGIRVEDEPDNEHENNFTENVHLCVIESINCIFTKINTYAGLDPNGATYSDRPSNSVTFKDNQFCIICMNNFAGFGRTNNKDIACDLISNEFCSINSNILDSSLDQSINPVIGT